MIVLTVLTLTICLKAQDSKLIIVKAGTWIFNYFPEEERYRYPDFAEGQVQFKDGNVSTGWFNYNFLTGEMEYIQLPDTLFIVNRRKISLIAIEQDTFYYHNGYLELIYDSPVKVGLKQYFRLREVLKKGAFGTTARGVSIDTYIRVPRGNSAVWIQNEDLVYQKTQKYYFSTPNNDFIRFSRKNVMLSFPKRKDIIKEYLKSKIVDFSSADDLIRLADFLCSILPPAV